MSFTQTKTMTGDGVAVVRGTLAAALCWGVAAIGSHLALHAFGDPTAVFMGRMAVVVLCGLLLGRIGEAFTSAHALAVGVAWATLAIGTEIYLTTHGIGGWYELLGNPATNPEWMRAATLVAWFLAPMLGVRGEPADDRGEAL